MLGNYILNLFYLNSLDESVWATPLNLGLQFYKLSILSVLCGIMIGMISSYLFRKFRFLSNSPIVENSIILYLGYTSYTISEYFNLSGVISLLICGIFLGHYNWYNLSNEGKITTGFLTFIVL